jgi:rod shape-determining protein MreD
MVKKILLACALAVIAAVLQSTVLSRLAIFGAVPDLALTIVVFCAYINGTMAGQLSGFCSGLLLDFLSAAPLGLNAFIRTLAGALAGLLKGAFFLDFFLLPMALCAAATAVKAIALFPLHLLLPGSIPAYSLFTPTLWIELGLNAVTAPFVFALLKLVKGLAAGRNGR